MLKVLSLSVFIILLGSCQQASKNAIDLSDVDVNVKIERFDVDFYTATKDNFEQVKQTYPMLFPHHNDSIWFSKISNIDEQQLYIEAQKVFSNTEKLRSDLTSLFKHVKYYQPKFKSPKVITILTNIDYDNRVLLADSLLFISLDVYLGRNHPFYNEYPNYIKQNNTADHVIIDVANAIVEQQLPPIVYRRFIDKIIFEGKKMYLLDRYLPKTSDYLKIGYSKEKFDWAVNSEEDVWKYFIDRELLYDTSQKLNQRFIDIAPFSKFYLGEDNLSPGRMGVFMGWQIVRAFMANNDVSLQQLINTTEEDIFNKSKYKPKK